MVMQVATSLTRLKKTAFERFFCLCKKQYERAFPLHFESLARILLGKRGIRHEVKRACICCHPGTGVCDHHFHRNATRCSEAGNSLSRFLTTARNSDRVAWP